MTIKRIECNDAPKAIGPYSQAVEAGDNIFVSGQIPLDPVTGEMVKGDISVQTARVIQNIENILYSCGSGLNKVVRCDVFLKDMNDFGAMNAVYAMKFSGDVQPARFVIQAAALPKNALIEMACIVYKK